MHLAHEHPERPFIYGTHLCTCRACAIAAEAAARRTPTVRLVLKMSAAPRQLVTVAEFLQHHDELADVYGWPEHDDYVREVFVAERGAENE